MTLEKLQTEAYRRYQLDWMISHNRSALELIQSVVESIQRGADPDDPDEINILNFTPKELEFEFQTWQEDTGFDGTLWVCFDEFLQAEFTDEAYMQGLLTRDQFQAYQNFKKTGEI